MKTTTFIDGFIYMFQCHLLFEVPWLNVFRGQCVYECPLFVWMHPVWSLLCLWLPTWLSDPGSWVMLLNIIHVYFFYFIVKKFDMISDVSILTVHCKFSAILLQPLCRGFPRQWGWRIVSHRRQHSSRPGPQHRQTAPGRGLLWVWHKKSRHSFVQTSKEGSA